jgi:hypothetical protein
MASMAYFLAMNVCSSCETDAPDSARFCPKCGASLATADAPTIDRSSEADDGMIHRPASTPPSAPSRPISHSSGSLPHGRFLPGMVIGGRYRMVSMLGRGGMGEVYRADDLSLGQQVALKFLPSDLARDPERLDRFRQEVRTARQVSHPNVCRVYDIGEVDGEHFISMEYVEGEDLGHLLRRIGRLPEAKAIQIARQIAAGLAAAHDRNLVHRDLKPANIMLDERGIARITDFGLAATSEDLEGTVGREGTPQYMAPEQLEGGSVAPHSDIYALGLVLYELFTGNRAFDATTLSELIRIREESDLGSLSRSMEGIDPAVVRVILRCLEHDPARRPQSALAVSAALPGGDPLAAAIAAGETPSPEMVAAAGDEGSLSARAATILLVLSIVGLAILPFLSRWSGAVPPLTMEHGPQVMRAKAREMLQRLGFESKPADVAYGYFTMQGWLSHLEKTDSSENPWASLEDHEHPLFGFWYRESPVPLINYEYFAPGIAGGVVSSSSPYPRRVGELLLAIDDRGRLWSLASVPPQLSQPGADDDGDPFSALLREAGLEETELARVEPEWTPPYFATERRAWTTPLGPDLEMRIEAAAFADQPVSLRRVFPWTEAQRIGTPPRPVSHTVVNAIQIAIFLAILGGAVLMARRNIRMGRGDRRGAFRLALFMFLSVLTLWLFDADHVASFSEFGLLVIALSWGLFFASLFWVIYVALEPYIRRRWPDMLISWSRLLSGRFRDALVGRDLLIGVAAGIAINLLLPHVLHVSHILLGYPAPRPRFINVAALDGPMTTLVGIFSQVTGAIAAAFFATFLLFLLLLVLRRQWLAAATVIALGSLLSTLGQDGNWIMAVLFLVIWSLVVTILVRFGMLAAIVTIFSSNALMLASNMPGGFDRLVAAPIAISLAVGLAMVCIGFVFSLGGRPLIAEDFLDR